MPTITYGNHEIDTSKLPAASIEALLSRGLTHFLGNEQASKVVSKAKTLTTERFAAHQSANPSDESTEMSAFELSADERTELKERFVAEALKALHEGTIGVRAPRQPSIDPLEAEIERVAKAQVKAVLSANGIKAPKDGEVVTFGDGTKRSMDEMVANRIGHATHGPSIRAEAERNLKAKAKAKAAKDKAAIGLKVESADVDSLGL